MFYGCDMVWKNLLLNLKYIGILTVSVYFFYELLWLFIMGDPSNFWSTQDVLLMTYEFIFCTGFCLVSYLLSLQAGRIANNKLRSVYSKVLLLTVGMLAVNFLWAWIYSLLVDTLTLVIFGEKYVDMLDVFAVAVVSTLVLSLMLTARYVKAYIEETELRKKEHDMATDIAIRNLQLQISPHFLFNNLSTLSTLIDTDRKLADDFISHMSLFYRHTLKNLSDKLIPLKEELKELEDYLFLIKTRFGEAIEIRVKDAESCSSMLVPPGSLQLLVENCIKHNSFSRREPLHIEIECVGSTIVVRNEYRPLKSGLKSFSIGQNNVRERFRLLNSDDVTISHDNNTYSVTIPLIKRK